MNNADCIFCRIAARQAPARIVYQDELVTVFPDAAPSAPVHLLIIPNKHIDSINELQAEDAQIVSHMVMTAKQMAENEGVRESGYRLLINMGKEGGQTVFHLHMHLIGGRHLRRSEILGSM